MRGRPEPEETEPGQESVWDYPRPPALEQTDRHLVVVHDGQVIAETERGWRVLETSHPPNYYVPSRDVDMSQLERSSARTTHCEWKGEALHWDLVVGDDVVEQVAWSYPEPTERYDPLAGALAFYPQRLDEARVDGERVEPQPGDFYGGWITSDVVGPFKGEPGTGHW